MDEYNNGNYLESLKQFLIIAENDFRNGKKSQIAENYIQKIFDKKILHDEKFMKWIVEAATANNSCVQNYLGILHKNDNEALKWYKLSADQGNSYGQNNLADCYYNGKGIAKDIKKALILYNLSYKNGCKNAKNNMIYGVENNIELVTEMINEYELAIEEKNKTIEEKNKTIEENNKYIEHLELMPGGPGYEKAKNDFVLLAKIE